MIESLTEEDDLIIDGVLEKTNKLADLTDFIINFFGRPGYNTTRETLLGNTCQFLSDTMQVAIATMTTKACRVSVYLALRCKHTSDNSFPPTF